MKTDGTDSGGPVCADEKPPCPELEGRKFDSAKPDWTLFPFDAAEAVVRILEHGAKKYDRNNWQHVDDGRRRYLAAAQRHLAAAMGGELTDGDSGMSHMAHLACNALFLIWFELQEENHEDPE